MLLLRDENHFRWLGQTTAATLISRGRKEAKCAASTLRSAKFLAALSEGYLYLRLHNGEREHGASFFRTKEKGETFGQ